jgi:MFS family permease
MQTGSNGDGETAKRISPWGSLTFRDFRYLWTASLFLGISRFMRDMLQYYLIYDISGSAVSLGLTGLFQAVPSLVLGLIAGSMADAVNRKKMIVITQTFALIVPFTIAYLVATDQTQVWHLWLLTSVTSATGVMGNPAQRSLVPRLVPRSHVMNAVTLFSGASQGTQLIGPMFAAFVAAQIGMQYAFVANGALQVAALLLIVMIRTSGAPEGNVHRPMVSLSSILDGLRFIKVNNIIWAGFLIDFAVMLFGYYRFMFAVLATDVYGVGLTEAAQLGMLGALNTAVAVGSVTATVGLLAIGDLRRKGVLILAAYMVYAGALVILGSAPWFWLAVVGAWAIGVGDMASYTGRHSVIQLVAPDDFRGRTSATSNIFTNVSNSTGSTQMGFMASLVGPQGALLLGGLLSAALITIVGFRVKALWNYGKRGSDEQAVGVDGPKDMANTS